MESLYAWPRDTVSENKASVLAAILKESFEQSGTKIKNPEALLSAARHIVQSDRVARLELTV